MEEGSKRNTPISEKIERKKLRVLGKKFGVQHTPSKDDKPLGRDLFLMGVAELLRWKSHDKNLKVGCVLVRSDNREIVGIGYNGFVQGIANSQYRWDGREKDNYLLHAEMNAVHFSRLKDLDNILVYVTCFPCKNCAPSLIQKRVRSVIFNMGVEKYYQPSNTFLDASETPYYPIASLFNKMGKMIAFKEILDWAKKPENKEPDDEERRATDRPKRFFDNWDTLLMNIALLASKRCNKEFVPESRIGGCVVIKGHADSEENYLRWLGYGYSGIPQKCMKPEAMEKLIDLSHEELKPLVRDAIRNALVFLDRSDSVGATIYSTHYPTIEAVLECCQRKISKILWLEDSPSVDKEKIENLLEENSLKIQSFHKMMALKDVKNSTNFATNIIWVSANSPSPVDVLYGTRTLQTEKIHIHTSKETKKFVAEHELWKQGGISPFPPSPPKPDKSNEDDDEDDVSKRLDYA